MADDPFLVTSAERVARLFHYHYERLAPDFGYRTREKSAKPWDEVPETNRRLMVATVAAVLADLRGPSMQQTTGV